MAKAKKKNRTRYPEQSRLLTLVIKKLGGVSHIARTLKTSTQIVSFWRVQGYVPLARLQEVATTFKLNPFVLNFAGYKVATGKDQTWNETLEAAKLTRGEMEFVRHGK
jgi:hypothetical protein